MVEYDCVAAKLLNWGLAWFEFVEKLFEVLNVKWREGCRGDLVVEVDDGEAAVLRSMFIKAMSSSSASSSPNILATRAMVRT
jgi:hypothetical protein